MAKNYKRMYKVSNQMRTHYQELYTTAISELCFKNQLLDAAMVALRQIKYNCDDAAWQGYAKAKLGEIEALTNIHNRKVAKRSEPLTKGK